MPDHSTTDVRAVTVCRHGHCREWQLTLQGVWYEWWAITLRSPEGAEWTGGGTNIWACLIRLRRQLEPQGYIICVNGCRANAWSSGMLRDMDQGGSVYLVDPDLAPGERPPNVFTLDAAPFESCVTFEEQFPRYASPPASEASAPRWRRFWRRARRR